MVIKAINHLSNKIYKGTKFIGHKNCSIVIKLSHNNYLWNNMRAFRGQL